MGTFCLLFSLEGMNYGTKIWCDYRSSEEGITQAAQYLLTGSD